MAEEIISLVKFCSVDSGLKILNSQSLRWSAPHLFNDPFEPDYRSQADFTPEGLLRGIIKEAITMLFGAREPTGKSNRLVAAISRWREEERFTSEEEAESVLTQLLGQIARQQQEHIDEYMKLWRQFTSSLRICCFCDKPTNMSAWQRYADNHAGIALKFSAGEDSSLPAPMRVNYTTTPPLVTTLKEQIAVTYGRQAPPTPEDFIEKLLSKDRENKAEREWRCFAQEEGDPESDDQVWYSNKVFKAHELKAIYLGLGIKPEDRESIVHLARQHFRNSRIFQARALPGRYEIDFDQL